MITLDISLLLPSAILILRLTDLDWSVYHGLSSSQTLEIYHWLSRVYSLQVTNCGTSHPP